MAASTALNTLARAYIQTQIRDMTEGTIVTQVAVHAHGFTSVCFALQLTMKMR